MKKNEPHIHTYHHPPIPHPTMKGWMISETFEANPDWVPSVSPEDIQDTLDLIHEREHPKNPSEHQ